MSIIIGIDQSFTSTGICVVDGIDLIHHEIISTPSNKEDQYDKIKRALHISGLIVELAKKYNVDAVRIEGLAFMSAGDATRDLAILQGYIIRDLVTEGYQFDDIKIITPTSLKKFATDDGRADKNKMFDCLPEKVRELFAPIPKTKGRFDLTDAFYLSVFGNDEYLEVIKNERSI